MSLLSGLEIIRQRARGTVTIEPFDPKRVGANSYDLRLSPILYQYKRPNWFIRLVRILFGVPWCLDAKKDNPTKKILIPKSGFVLKPGNFYLGKTVEAAGAEGFVPCIEGRSSIARLGVAAHISAGFGDDGYVNPWTLEITAELPVRLYSGMRICQIFFSEIRGNRLTYQEVSHCGKYHDPSNVSSQSFRDYEFEEVSNGESV